MGGSKPGGRYRLSSLPAPTVRELFSEVAPRYDLLNRLLSLGVDRSWRQKVAGSLDIKPLGRVLDVCTGTGELAVEIASRARCFASDFNSEMLLRTREKSSPTQAAPHLIAADALRLPFPADTFDAVTVAFGVRNLENLSVGLSEFRRVLRRGSTLTILEFARPTHPLLRLAYGGYLHGLLPLIGRWVSRSKGAYRYLADSIAGFLDPETLSRCLQETGYNEVSFRRMTGGIVTLHRARKPD